MAELGQPRDVRRTRRAQSNIKSEGESMPELNSELKLEVTGNEITVTLPGSRYSVIYFKRRGSSGLLAKDMVSKNDQRFPRMTASQFLREAWNLANDKARELGWIV
jgi:hypothetical protein